jgi:hypothetical protein
MMRAVVSSEALSTARAKDSRGDAPQNELF